MSLKYITHLLVAYIERRVCVCLLLFIDSNKMEGTTEYDMADWISFTFIVPQFYLPKKK